MDRLATAIVTQWNTAGGATLRNYMADPAKGLWLDLAPHNTLRPFIVFRFLAIPVIGTMVTTGISGMIFDASIDIGISVDPYKQDQAFTIAGAWKTLFDNQLLTLSTGRVILARRTGDGTLINDLDAGYVLSLPYRYIYTNE
jgi:hypothetical protein